MSPETATAVDRRTFPRLSFESPFLLRPAEGGGVISCSTVDLSLGGARVTATDVIPLGSCDVTFDAEDGPVSVSVSAEVREVIVDVETGVVVARLQFVGVPKHERERLADLMGMEAAAVIRRPRRTRRVAIVVASLVVAGALVAIAVASAGDPGRSASPGATRIERADSALRIVVTEDPKETVALSAAGLSEAIEPVQVRLEAGVPQVSGQVPVVVTVVNNGSTTLSFGDGLRATVQARREAGPLTELVLSSKLKELAPGERTSVRGIIDLGQPGAYDLDVLIRVTK